MEIIFILLLHSSKQTTVANSFASRGENSASEPPTLNGVGDITQNESIVPSDSSSSDNILVRLNDDCMIKAFEFLPLSDLCNVADVCRVFEKNALSVFKRRHSDLDLDELLGASDRGNEYDSEYGTDNEDESVNDARYKLRREPLRLLEMKTVEKLFLHFGAYIQTFDLDVEDEDQRHKILEMLATYCAHEDIELNKLKMTDVTIGPDYIPRIQTLFDRVKVLDVTGGAFSTVYIGAELTELILEDIHLPEDVAWKFEKLQTLSLIDVQESNSGAIESLLHSNPQVKRLIITSRTWNFWWNVLRMSSELEELELDVSLEPGELDDYDYLARLQHLRVFKFNCMDSSMTKVLKRFVQYHLPIEELSFSNFTLEFNACLTGLSKLKKLSLSHGGWYGMVQLSNVIKGLPNLEKLYLIGFGCVTIDEIKATIENAPKLNEFIVNFYDIYKEFKLCPIDYYGFTANVVSFGLVDDYNFSVKRWSIDDTDSSDETDSCDDTDSSDQSESGEE